MIVALVVCFVRFHSIFHIILLKRFQNHAVGLRIIREKVFKNGRSEIFYRLSSQISLGPFLTTLCHMFSQQYQYVQNSIYYRNTVINNG